MTKLLTGASEEIVSLLAMFGVTDIKGVCGADIRIRSKEIVNIRLYKEVEINDKIGVKHTDWVAVPRDQVPGITPEAPPIVWDYNSDTEDHVVLIDYTNYRGETKRYRIQPKMISYGSTQFHPDDQWLMEAIDLDRHVTRMFSVKDILHWEPAK